MDFAHQQRNPASKMIGIGIVVALHVALIYALLTGLAHKVVEIMPAPIETKILKEDVVTEEPPPPPLPDFDEPPPPFIPPPEIVIASPPVTRPNAITTVTTERAPPAPPAPVKRVAPVVKAGNCRLPDYPAVSERLGETGTVVLQLLVGVDGKVTDSRVEVSSGYTRLDDAAIKGLSRCRFTPGTVDGVPQPGWAQIKYKFQSAR